MVQVAKRLARAYLRGHGGQAFADRGGGRLRPRDELIKQ